MSDIPLPPIPNLRKPRIVCTLQVNTTQYVWAIKEQYNYPLNNGEEILLKRARKAVAAHNERVMHHF